MFNELRLRSGTNWVNYTILPDFKDLSYDSRYLDVGIVTFTVTQEYADSLGLGDDSIVEVAPNGISRYNLWYNIDGTSGTRTADGVQWKTLTGKSLVSLLAECRVYPSSWPTLPVINADGSTTPVIQGHSFQNATPGTILRTLIARGKGRGGLTWLDETSFTGTTTSNGVAWGQTLSPTYATGTTLLQVIQDLAERRAIQFRMNGAQLQVYNYDSQISFKTPEQVTLRRGLNVLEQSTNTNSAEGASVVLIQGDQTAIAEVSTLPDGSAPSVSRRRELFVAQGGITDVPTLQFLAKAQLAISGHIKYEESIAGSDILEPWTNYDVGDWIWEDKNGTLENYQVKQIAVSTQDNTSSKIGLTLGDVLDDLDSRFQQRMDAITGAGTGTYGGLPNSIQNYLAPSAPTSIAANATAYRDSNGIDFAQVTVSWAAPITNIDGTTLTDLDRYEVQFRTDATSAWQQAANVPPSQTAAYISSLPTGANFTCQVRAVDTSGNASSWAALSGYVALPKVTITPATPSTPTASSAFQNIVVTWDGKNSSGGVYGSEWARTDVYVGTASNFTPTTIAESFTTRGGSLTIGGLAYSTTYYIKLIAVDKSGNSSLASTASSAVTAAQLSDPDLPAKLITGAKIADGTINTTQLTVASFGDSVVPNGSFEDVNSATTTGASHWAVSTNAITGATAITASSGGATGTNCLKIGLPASTSGFAHWTAGTDEIPTAVGDVWYVKGKIKADRAQVISSTISLAFGQAGGANLPIAGNSNNPIVVAVTLTPTTNWTEFEGQVVVPSGTVPNPLTRMKIILSTISDGSSNNIYWDDIAVRPVGGSASIKDASIINAKIANVSADKITVGTLSADVTVSARIKTSDTGARVELNSTGLHAYDAFGNQTLFADDSNGSVTITGALHGGEAVFPDPLVDAAGHVTLNSSGFSLDTVATTNLVLNPNFQNASNHLTGVTLGTGVTGAYVRGPAVTDWKGNVDLLPLYGDGSLKVYKTTGAGTFTIDLGVVQPGQTYTVSWHTCLTNINDTVTLAYGYGDWSQVQVQRSSDSTVAATGRTGFYWLPGQPFAGDSPGVKNSGIDIIAGSGWVNRFYNTFTIPSGWAANTPVRLQLPTPVNSDGSANTSIALCVSAVQLEAHPYITRYTDGDQPGASWNGTIGASTSSRWAQKSAFFPAASDPYIQGKQTLPYLETRKIKLGSGSPHGSNYTWQGGTSQNIPSNAWTDAVWSAAANSDRIAQDDGIIQPSDFVRFYAYVPGFYLLFAQVVWPSGSTGDRGIRILRFDGAVVSEPQWPDPAKVAADPAQVIWAGALTTGQWIKVQVYQSSGATLNMNGAANLGDSAAILANCGFCQLA